MVRERTWPLPVELKQAPAVPAAAERVYVAVSYPPKDPAKALGARWDRAPPRLMVRADLTKFERRTAATIDNWRGSAQAARLILPGPRQTHRAGTTYTLDRKSEMRRAEADVTVQILIAAGARRRHGVAAPALNFFGDALRRVGRICFVDIGHEGVGAFAAGEDALLRDKLTLCARSSSPRILHFSNGPFKSRRKRAPIFRISSQVVREELGREFSQEVAFRPAYPDCSELCAEIRTAFSARRMTAWLLRLLGASRLRRADRTAGVSGATAHNHELVLAARRARPPPRAADEGFDQIAEAP